jgi:hypothetical protein
VKKSLQLLSNGLENIFEFFSTVMHGGNLHSLMNSLRDVSWAGSKNSFLSLHNGTIELLAPQLHYLKLENQGR